MVVVIIILIVNIRVFRAAPSRNRMLTRARSHPNRNFTPTEALAPPQPCGQGEILQ
jgi:hypothetical protein